jgi:hypothetical protein
VKSIVKKEEEKIQLTNINCREKTKYCLLGGNLEDEKEDKREERN